MNRTTGMNAVGVLAALAAAAVVASGTRAVPPPPAAIGTSTSPSLRRERLPDGGVGLRDASGVLVPLRAFRRIVSTSLVADRLLVEMAELDRVVAFSTSAARMPWAFRCQGKAAVDGFGPVEAIVALKPDLVLVNSYSTAARDAKLRASRVAVFDLGEVRGLATLLPAARMLGALLGDEDRGARLARSVAARLARVAAPLGDRPRRRALYLAIIGDRLFGGTVGTSYHDVLHAAGLADAAAERFRQWPQYSVEQVLALAPEVIVTKQGMAAALCRHPGLEALAACQGAGTIIEVPAPLLDEAGPAMLDAAELVFDAAYPR